MTKRKPSLHKRVEALVDELVDKGIRLEEVFEQVERAYLARVLDRCDGTQSRAAELLDVHRNTLRRRLRKHGLI